MSNLRHWIRMVEGDDSVELDRLKHELAGLMAKWNEIKASEPEPFDTGQGYKIQTPQTKAWHDDPERGRFWNLHIYPMNQRIQELEAEIRKQARVRSLQTKRGEIDGFDTSEILYHGTDAEFEHFDRSKVRTASHLYTSPDLETAESYGKHVYAVYGRQEPQAVLTAEDMDYKIVRRIHRTGGFRKGWDLSLNDLIEIISNGELYSYSNSSSLQDDVISTALGLGFRSVRITDSAGGGRYTDSVIFGDANDLQIVEKLR